MNRAPARWIFAALLSIQALSPHLANAADTPANATCEDAYRKVFSACYPGRAEPGLELPDNANFGAYSGLYTSSWNYGPYTKEYAGPAFVPQGAQTDRHRSILPPYMWGAVGQTCDGNFDPETHARCAANMEQKLRDEALNARSLHGEFYWRAHGHNCHDAAEDIGMCLRHASPWMPSGCKLEAKVIVWDSEPDIQKALGDVYHSQILVKKVQENPSTHAQEEVVCLTESQAKNSSGTTTPGCCSTNLSLFEGGTGADYQEAFGSCSNFFTPAPHPHIYAVKNFRKKRQTGKMDVPTTYNRWSGISALFRPATYHNYLTERPLRVQSAIYDKQGVAVAVIVE